MIQTRPNVRRNGQFLPDPKTGKYIGKFDTHDEAQAWADEFRLTTLKKWNGKYVPKGKRKNVQEMLDELARDGIKLHRATLYRWMRVDEDIAFIPRRASESDRHTLIKAQIRLTKEVFDVINSLPNKSNFTEWALRLMFGMSCPDMLAVHYKDGRVALFIQRPGDIQIILMDDFTETETKALQALASIAQQSEGLKTIKKHVDQQGLRWFGGV